MEKADMMNGFFSSIGTYLTKQLLALKIKTGAVDNSTCTPTWKWTKQVAQMKSPKGQLSCKEKLLYPHSHLCLLQAQKTGEPLTVHEKYDKMDRGNYALSLSSAYQARF